MTKHPTEQIAALSRSPIFATSQATQPERPDRCHWRRFAKVVPRNVTAPGKPPERRDRRGITTVESMENTAGEQLKAQSYAKESHNPFVSEQSERR